MTFKTPSTKTILWLKTKIFKADSKFHVNTKQNFPKEEKSNIMTFKTPSTKTNLWLKTKIFKAGSKYHVNTKQNFLKKEKSK